MVKLFHIIWLVTSICNVFTNADALNWQAVLGWSCATINLILYLSLYYKK